MVVQSVDYVFDEEIIIERMIEFELSIKKFGPFSKYRGYFLNSYILVSYSVGKIGPECNKKQIWDPFCRNFF